MAICSTFVIVKMSILRYEKSSAKYLTDNLISKLCAGSICHRPPIMATLHGVVKDGDVTPLPYTTIYINGTSRGVTADDNGRYSMV